MSTAFSPTGFSRRKKFIDVVVYRGCDEELPIHLPNDPRAQGTQDPTRVLRQAMRHLHVPSTHYGVMSRPEVIHMLCDAFWWIFLDRWALDDHAALLESFRIELEKLEQEDMHRQLSGGVLLVHDYEELFKSASMVQKSKDGTTEGGSTKLPWLTSCPPHLRSRSLRNVVLSSRPVPKEAGERALHKQQHHSQSSVTQGDNSLLFPESVPSTPRSESAMSAASSGMTWYSVPSDAEEDDKNSMLNSLEESPTLSGTYGSKLSLTSSRSQTVHTRVDIATELLNYDAGGGVYRGPVTTEGVKALATEWQLGQNAETSYVLRCLRVEQHRLFRHMSIQYATLFKSLSKARREQVFPRLPEVLAVAIVQTLIRTAPYLRHKIDASFKADVKRRLTYWILGVESADVKSWYEIVPVNKAAANASKRNRKFTNPTNPSNSRPNSRDKRAFMKETIPPIAGYDSSKNSPPKYINPKRPPPRKPSSPLKKRPPSARTPKKVVVPQHVPAPPPSSSNKRTATTTTTNTTDTVPAVRLWRSLQQVSQTHIKTTATAMNVTSVLASMVDEREHREVEDLRNQLAKIMKRNTHGKGADTDNPEAIAAEFMASDPQYRDRLRRERLEQELAEGKHHACWYETGRLQSSLVSSHNPRGKKYFALTFCSPLFKCYLEQTGCSSNQVVKHRDLYWET